QKIAHSSKMTSINLHIGKSGSLYKLGYEFVNGKSLGFVSEVSPENLPQVGAYLGERGFTDVNFIQPFKTPLRTKETLLQKLDANEVSSGAIGLVEQQIRLFGLNSQLDGLSEEEAKMAYALIISGMAS
ncbi:MAG: hypothetical protein Q8R00_00060, partial [Candidatus Nanoarchaeia archaeon]|nr:hypothetical protein [Candidatus Nanoarchaeia archaeon]